MGLNLGHLLHQYNKRSIVGQIHKLKTPNMIHPFKLLTVNSRHNNTITFFKSLHSTPTFFTSSSPSHLFLHQIVEKCTTMKQLKLIHAQIILHGLTKQTLTLSKIISFCSLSASADLQHAQLLFDQLPQPNRYMYNSLIRGYSNCDDPMKAIFLYGHMICSGIYPNEFTFPFVLKACASVCGYLEGSLVHVNIVKLGFASHVCVQNGLISVYFSCGVIRSAEKVFDGITDRTLVSWNSMISGYSKMGCCQDAFKLFREMREIGMGPDGFTFVSLLSVCSHKRNVGLGRFVHLYIVINGVEIDMHVQNALVDMYAKCRHLDMAQAFFDQMSYRNVVSWTSMVSAYAKHGLVECAKKAFDQIPFKNVVSWNSMISCYIEEGFFSKALDLFNEMCTAGVAPDETTLASILSACCQLGNLVMGKKVHDYICSIYKTPSVTLYNSLIDMYAKCGSLETSLCIFHEMPEKNLVSWNIIITAHALHGHGDKAVELFENMEASKICPDEITFTGLLSACCHSGLISKGRYYFSLMSQIYGISPEIEHFACMVDLFGRVGLFEEAIKLIRTIPMKPDIVVWGALLGACRIHRKVEIGKQIIKQVLELEVPYSSGVYVLISNMFCEAGRWEDVKKIRKLMNENGVRKSSAISAIEIDGRVSEFMVDDLRHELSEDIYVMVDQLSDHLKVLGFSCHITSAFLDAEEI